MCVILGNMYTGQLDIKIPQFKDENSGNPLEFLDDVTRFCQIKKINDECKFKILSVMLQRKARIWFELQSSFHTFDEFKKSFIDEFYTVAIQVKIKNKWLNTKFNSNDDKSLQTFYYKQMKKSKYLLPVMTDFEKNYSIVQQFPSGVRKSLASINYNDNNVIVLALANLDEIHDEKRRNFERRSNFQNQNNAEAINVAQIHAQNGYQGHNRRGRGRFRGYSNYRPYGKQYVNTQPSQTHITRRSFPTAKYYKRALLKSPHKTV